MAEPFGEQNPAYTVLFEGECGNAFSLSRFNGFLDGSAQEGVSVIGR